MLCREEGRTLSQLAAVPTGDKKSSKLSGFELFGIVKETGVDNEGLIEFHDKFFSYPLYRDDANQFYGALGNRKLGLETWNPFRLYRGFKEMNERLAEKEISGNMKGEGIVQGGIVVFDNGGKVRGVYLEKTGNDFPTEDLLSVVKSIRDEHQQSLPEEL